MSFENPTMINEDRKNTIENESPLLESTRKRLEEFMSLPDSPGIPYDEQLKLREISERTKSPADIENYKKSKESKYRGNALMTPLTMVQAFIIRAPEAERMSQNEKNKILDRIKKVSEDIRPKSASQLITKESVDEVIDIVKSTLDFINERELARS